MSRNVSDVLTLGTIKNASQGEKAASFPSNVENFYYLLIIFSMKIEIVFQSTRFFFFERCWRKIRRIINRQRGDLYIIGFFFREKIDDRTTVLPFEQTDSCYETVHVSRVSRAY